MSGISRRSKQQRGFTLIEVLVALAILALVAGGVLSMISQTTRFIAAAEDQLAASVVADNVMVERLVREQPLEEGEETIELVFAGRNWVYTRTITDTGASGLFRIDIAVRRADSPQILARATTLRGRS
ncbi:MAG: type II secretion system minor pseudopilin GspI [Pseudomonadota bacterium]